ncbi:MAG: cytochrome c biogenesis CcdA family protein [Candidatus Hydrothermarchaeales archaeon]
MNDKRRALAILIVFASALALVAWAGLGTWSSYVLPNLARIGTFSQSTILVFAFLAGLISFFAPCALPLLPGYISFYLGSVDENSANGGIIRPLRLGLLGALGIITFFGLIGAVLSVLGTSAAPYFTALKPVITLVIILLGLSLYRGYSLDRGFLGKMARKTMKNENILELGASGKVFLFGAGYGAASLGCTLPLFLAIVLYPLLGGSFAPALTAFALYSSAMGLMMLLTTLLVSRSKEAVLRELAGSMVRIKRASGVVLVLVGIYLIYYYLLYGM